MPSPPITCVRVMTTGDTDDSSVVSRISASASSTVSRLKVCAPWLTPPCALEPGVTMIMLVPRFWICSAMRVRAP